jgi:hypothetical protein
MINRIDNRFTEHTDSIYLLAYKYFENKLKDAGLSYKVPTR